MKIPDEILALFERESEGITYGSIHLELFLRDGRPRFVLSRERSIYPNTDTQSADSSSANMERKKTNSPTTPDLRKRGEK